VAHVPEKLPDQEAVVIAHPMTFQSLDDLSNLGGQAPVTEFSDLLG
jgi:hypothetical protein